MAKEEALPKACLCVWPHASMGVQLAFLFIYLRANACKVFPVIQVIAYVLVRSECDVKARAITILRSEKKKK